MEHRKRNSGDKIQRNNHRERDKKRGECQVRNCSWGNSDSQELHAMTQLTGC